MENETETVDSTNDTETTENPVEETTEVDVEALKKENATLQAQKEHWRKKAEEKGKPEAKVESPKDDLSPKDLYALMEAKVAQEDVDEVVKAAKILGKTVPEALKDDVVKSILNRKNEERQTADVSNTQSTRRVTSKNTPEALLDQARKGNFPETEEDMLKTADAYLMRNKKK